MCRLVLLSFFLLQSFFAVGQDQEYSACDNEHLKYVFKNFKAARGIECQEIRGLLLVRKTSFGNGKYSLEIISDNDNTRQMEDLKKIYLEMPLSCVREQKEFEVLISISVDECPLDKNAVNAFLEKHGVVNPLINQMNVSLPHICGSRGYSASSISSSSTYKGYNGLAPLKMKPVEIKWPIH